MIRRSTYVAAFAVAAAAALAYALYTRSAWEDWFITYRASKNLALGYGLLFTPGQRVHTFTSPLGTLIPAFLSWITGNHNDTLVLWLFRVMMIPAFAASVVVIMQAARGARFQASAIVLLAACITLDAKMVEFSIDGMETALDLLFIALTLRALLAPGRRPALELGLAWAGLMWTRPDGFVHAGSLALGCLLFHPAALRSDGRADLIQKHVRAAVIAAIVYAPWFLWAWWYYGSPVPNPVHAKAVDLAQWPIKLETVMYPLRLLAAPAYGDPTFLPFYAQYGGWPAVLQIMTYLSVIAGFYWLVPIASRPVRAVSFAFMLGNYYLTVLTPKFPWYFPAATMLGWFVIAGTFNDLWRGIDAVRDRIGPAAAALRRGLQVIAACLLLALLATMVASAYMRRVQQVVNDEGNRKPMALWLAANRRAPSDTVFLEPLGYVGFFSNLKTYDYPGLSSPEVVAARRAVGDNWARLIAYLDPDWIVLRPSELATIERSDPNLLPARYTRAQVFDVSDRLATYRILPGRPLLAIDQTFFVFRRVPRTR